CAVTEEFTHRLKGVVGMSMDFDSSIRQSFTLGFSEQGTATVFRQFAREDVMHWIFRMGTLNNEMFIAVCKTVHDDPSDPQIVVFAGTFSIALTNGIARISPQVEMSFARINLIGFKAVMPKIVIIVARRLVIEFDNAPFLHGLAKFIQKV